MSDEYAEGWGRYWLREMPDQAILDALTEGAVGQMGFSPVDVLANG